MSLLAQSTIFLAAAVCVVPVAKRLSLGAVLGYLAAGIIIGPWGARLITDVNDILHFAELGVVLLLFIIGLELQPSRLWALRRAVFGLGGAQMALTTALITAAAMLLGLGFSAALVVGLALSLSSTAFALQMLAEKAQLTARHGRSAFAILLFQDLAVVPLLALVPALAPGGGEAASDRGWLFALQAVAVLAITVVVGRFVLGHLFRAVAVTRIREVFTALALLTLLGTALAMQAVGLSMAMGAFLAGVLLADSQYRHALEADIEPFKGLLLGLFFMAVGMSVNLGLVAQRPVDVALLTVALVVGKFAVLFAIGVFTGQGAGPALRLAAVISQGGEFAFVIFTVAVSHGVVPAAIAQILIVVVTLSMALTPLTASGVEAALARRGRAERRAFDVPGAGEREPQVIIAGFGRFGQIVGRILRARRIPFTALDASAEHVDFVRLYGNKTYYGDASNLDLLHAAGAQRARVFVLAIDDVQASLGTARTVREHYPDLPILARARNRKHAYQLMDLGVKVIRRETFASSLEIAEQVLRALGLPAGQAARLVSTFRNHDVRRLHDSHASHGDEERMRYLAMESARELEAIFAEDEADQELAR